MCAEYGRKKKGKKTRTGMTVAQLKDFCKKPLRKKNPHLSEHYDFIGFISTDIYEDIRDELLFHDINVKFTKDMEHKHDPKGRNYLELYVGKGQKGKTLRILALHYASSSRPWRIE